MRAFDYFKPKTLREAFELKKSMPGARFIAGGTDLMVQIKNREVKPEALISLKSIPELASVEVNGGVRIGALATITDILLHPELGRSFPILVQAARRLGSVQIRNVATIGGNICNCSPCADMALPLLVLEAKVKLQTAESEREVPLTDFFRGPGESCLFSDEILTEIIIEPSEEKAKTVFLKKGRIHMDLAVASIAMLVVLEGEKCLRACIAAGSVAPVPLRLYWVEELLKGAALAEKLIEKAQRLAEETVCPITDIRSTEAFRRQIVGVFVRRGLEQAFGRIKS